MIQTRITTLRNPAVGVGKRLARAARSERTRTTTTTTRKFGSLLPHATSAPNKATKPLHGNHQSIVPAHGPTAHSPATAHRRSMVTITQTKSTDAPLFSSPAAEDDASSLSTATTNTNAPIYVINEDSKLNVTQGCLNQVERLLRQRRERAGNQDDDKDNDGYFLRVYVDAGGCSGFQYQFEVDNDLDEDEDVVVVMAKIDSDGDSDGGRGLPRVVVDETSMGFLEGSTIDYVIEMIKSAFVVTDNPQSESACGCGSSFAVKNFEKFGARD